ncbi:MAG: glycine cleavage system protein T [bacterium]|nr:glycine cleavage system protein T [bacterium]
MSQLTPLNQVSSLEQVYRTSRAEIALDGIPLRFGDLSAEVNAAHQHAALFDRSHEGRLLLTGRDRLALVQRMSTNDVESLPEGSGTATLFTNANGRIIDRITLFHRGDDALVLTQPGRGQAVRDLLQRNIFFNDEVRLSDLAETHRQFALHGTQADSMFAALFPEIGVLNAFQTRAFTWEGSAVTAARLKPVVGSHYALLVPNAQAAALWTHSLNAGRAFGLVPAGSLAFNVLRIQAGVPGVGRELSGDYIPLEVGLWDEVSFKKGCYTGQEIIARMESRRKLAKTLVSIALDAPVDAPAPIFLNEREIGRLTSSVSAPDGHTYAMGVLKVSASRPGTVVRVGSDRIIGSVIQRLGVQPEHLEDED